MESLKKYEIINEELTMENEILKTNLEQTKKKENESVQKIEFLNVENKELREKLEQILYSKSYKFMQRIKKIIKRG